MSFTFDIASWDLLRFFGGSAAANPPAEPTKPKRVRKPKQNKEGAKGVTAKRAKTKREAAKRTKVNTRAQTQRDAVVASKRQSKTTQSVPETTKPTQYTVASPRLGALTKPDLEFGLLRNASRTVWIGELGDIREHKDSQVIGWATENGKMLGDLLKFVPDADQPDPRYV